MEKEKFKKLGITLLIKLLGIQYYISLVLFTIIHPLNSKAQTNNVIQSNASFAEKIYLQLDGKAYTTGNIVWFKAIVLNACDHVPSHLSRVLYVELVTPEEIIHEKKLIKIEDGIGQGFFYLGEDLPEGLYQIRAYTQWDRNFGSDFFFKEYIRVFAAESDENTEKPISNVTLIKEQDNRNRLKARFTPALIDSLHKKKLTIIVALDNKNDTLEVKSGKDDIYTLDYVLNEESQFATLQMQTENDRRYSTTIVLNKDFLDLQFFPESGEMVHGLKSKVGFKALDANGQGKRVEGDIVDEKDSVITAFKSNLLGMGSFILTRADSTKKYYARLRSQAEENEVLMYPLPKVASKGNILAVEKRGQNILVSALSNYLKNDSIELYISFRGMSFYEIKAKLNEGVFSVLLSANKFPEGIISFTMKDNLTQPVAERLYFNEKPDGRISLSISTDKDSYAERERTKLNIQATDSNGEPVNANLSVLVINKNQLGKIQEMRQNILSYFLLESELKGIIENPGYYFNNDSNMHSDLDVLMLSQGWRKYHYSKEYKEITFKPEHNLSVAGEVSGQFSTKRKKQAKLTMMTFGTDKCVYTQTADSAGRFKFNLEDEYGGNINALIQSSKMSGKKVNYTISLDKKESPPVNFDHVKTVENPDSVTTLLAEKDIERKKIDEAFPLDSGNILLDEVEVTALKLTPTRKKVIELYGEPDEIIDGKEIEAKEEKWSYGLYSVLSFNYPDEVKIITSSDGNKYAFVKGTDLTFVVVDGKPVKMEDYPLIPNIPPSEVSSFEIFKCADNFPRLFMEVTGKILRTTLCGGVIAIYTRGEHGIFARSSEGILKTNIRVFSAPREFYAPKYNNVQPDDWTKPDLRARVYWEPELKTDSLGQAKLSFYNADNTGEMLVIVETVSENGGIGYKQFDYSVEGINEKHIIVN